MFGQKELLCLVFSCIVLDLKLHLSKKNSIVFLQSSENQTCISYFEFKCTFYNLSTENYT